jgi:2-polyprenyl-3-methyl-5-hydroxy-6-metoxy-1,4-benzoquinol methylase
MKHTPKPRFDFHEVQIHRTKYFLSPQIDLYRNIYDKILPKIGEPALSILDYGCGNGVGTVRMRSPRVANLVGIDSDPAIIKFSEEVFGNLALFYCEDWQSEDPGLIIERDRQTVYNLITCIEVVEHVINPSSLIDAFRKKLVVGGWLVVSTLNHNSDFRKNDAHIGCFTVENYREFMNENCSGVRIVDYTLENDIEDGSGRTPMVALWQKMES